MQFLCLIYTSEANNARMTEAEREANFEAYGAFTQSVIDSGHYKGGEALLSVHTARTVTRINGPIEVTDGPFAETKEQLGGFYLLDAQDIDEAVQIAARIPATAHGRVEVRPIMVFDWASKR